jgi:hypothetical protein
VPLAAQNYVYIRIGALKALVERRGRLFNFRQSFIANWQPCCCKPENDGLYALQQTTRFGSWTSICDGVKELCGGDCDVYRQPIRANIASPVIRGRIWLATTMNGIANDQR